MLFAYFLRAYVILVVFASSLNAQTDSAGNAMPAQSKSAFLELGGSGGLGSINYEAPLWVASDYGPKFRDNCGSPPYTNYYFAWRVGFSFTPIDKNNGTALIFPGMVNWIFGCGKHKLEIGAGIAPTITTKGSFYVKSPMVAGYRYEPKEKRWFMRAGYTPIVGWLVDYQWQHWAGLSIGWKLK